MNGQQCSNDSECFSNYCKNGTCASLSCTSDENCSINEFCNSSSQCQQKKNINETCSQNNECSSNNCNNYSHRCLPNITNFCYNESDCSINEFCNYSNRCQSVAISSNISNSNISGINEVSIYYSNINNSNILNSTVNTSLIENSLITNSTITHSNIKLSNISNSSTINSILTNSSITNSNITNNSQLEHSIADATNVFNSSIINSNISESEATNSTIVHSAIETSNISNSTTSNSSILNSSILSSNVDNIIVINASISNNIVEKGIIKIETANGQNFTYTINNSGLYINGFYYSNETLNLTKECESNNDCDNFCDVLHRCRNFAIKEIYPDKGKTFKNNTFINVSFDGAINSSILEITLPNGTKKNFTLNVSKNFASVLLSNLIPSIQNGTYKFKIYATDVFGHSISSNEYNFTLNSSSFALNYVPPTPDNNVLLSQNFIINVTSDEQLDTCWFTVNNSNKTFMNKTDNYCYVRFDVRNLVDGGYLYNVYANNTNNTQNIIGSAGERRFIIDTTPPSAEINISTNTSDALINISYTEISNATFCYGISENNLNCTKIGFNPKHKHIINIHGLQSNTLYLFNLTFCDKQNNCNSTAGNFTTKVIDTVKPKILFLSINPTNESALIQINFSESSNISLNYGFNISNLSEKFSNLSYALTHSIRLSNLEKNKTYYYIITFCDEANNCNSTAGNFTTKKGIDDFCNSNDECYNSQCLSNKCVPVDWQCRINSDCGSGNYCGDDHKCHSSGTSRGGSGGTSGGTSSGTSSAGYNIISYSSCGNNICEGTENYTNCPSDCKKPIICGDKICEGNENYTNCPSDCKKPIICGDKICEGNESCINCPDDCGKCTLVLHVPKNLKKGENFTINVTTADGKPVANATVQYGNLTVYTDLYGQASFVALEDVKEINVSKEGVSAKEEINVVQEELNLLTWFVLLVVLLFIIALLLFLVLRRRKKEEEEKQEKEVYSTEKEGLIGLSPVEKQHTVEEGISQKGESGGLIGLK